MPFFVRNELSWATKGKRETKRQIMSEQIPFKVIIFGRANRKKKKKKFPSALSVKKPHFDVRIIVEDMNECSHIKVHFNLQH